MSWLISSKDGCTITVKATPRAAKSEIAGLEAEWLRVRVKAPPVDGKANAALIALFAELFGVPKRAVTVIAGNTSRLKRIRVQGTTAAAVKSILQQV